MRKTLSHTLFAATLGVAVATMTAGVATAQRGGTQTQRAANDRATTDLRAHLADTARRISDGQGSGLIPRARAITLQRQLVQTRDSMTRLVRQQGFASAGELASYDRTLRAVDVELDRRGVATSDGGGMRAAPVDEAEGGEASHDCNYDPVTLSIAGGRLDRALDQLNQVTHCPVSGTDLALGKRSRPVVGTMTATAALQAMLKGTGLQMHSIKGGFEITRLSR